MKLLKKFKQTLVKLFKDFKKKVGTQASIFDPTDLQNNYYNKRDKQHL